MYKQFRNQKMYKVKEMLKKELHFFFQFQTSFKFLVSFKDLIFPKI